MFPSPDRAGQEHGAATGDTHLIVPTPRQAGQETCVILPRDKEFPSTAPEQDQGQELLLDTFHQRSRHTFPQLF